MLPAAAWLVEGTAAAGTGLWRLCCWGLLTGLASVGEGVGCAYSAANAVAQCKILQEWEGTVPRQLIQVLAGGRGLHCGVAQLH